MLVLTPVYALSGTEEEGSIYYLTLANVDSDSNTLVGGKGRGGGGVQGGEVVSGPPDPHILGGGRGCWFW